MLRARLPIPCSAKPVVTGRWLGRAPGLERIRVTAHLRGPVTELRQHLADLEGQPADSREHLTREEFADRFGAHPSDIEAVSVFAENYGLDIVAVHPGRRNVELSGTIRQVSRAFGVRLYLYKTPWGVYRASVGPTMVPAGLLPIIKGVVGFDTRPLARPHFRVYRMSKPSARAAVGTGYSPLEVANLYDFPPGTGRGQCIALIELGGGFRQADLDQYFGQLGVTPPKVTAVSVGSGANNPTGNPNGADGEVMLDIEVAGSIAPGASIVVYFAPNTNQGFAEAVQAAVHDRTHRPSVISISWGASEGRWPLSARRMMNQAIQAGLAMGVTTFVAAGDNGSSDGLPGPRARVDFPASCRAAVGCGGTKLVARGGSIAGEVVWNDPGDGATGGGVSAIFGVPPYQLSVNPVSANPAHIPGRGVPDVAGNASPLTGYDILVDGQTGVIGGTSAVAPLWAGLLARIQEGLGHSAAPLLPSLYANPGAFRDITVGNNGAYHAGQGWDACTGLGSPNGTTLMTALSSASSTSDATSNEGSKGEAESSSARSSRPKST